MTSVLMYVYIIFCLKHPDLPLQSIDHLRTHWDWSKVKVYLVPSIAGRHEGWPNVLLTGHPRLMKVVRGMRMRTGQTKRSKRLVLECQVSIPFYLYLWWSELPWNGLGFKSRVVHNAVDEWVLLVRTRWISRRLVGPVQEAPWKASVPTSENRVSDEEKGAGKWTWWAGMSAYVMLVSNARVFDSG